MKNLIAIVICVLLAMSANGQEKSGIVKTDKGVLVNWNEPGNRYTIELHGKEIRSVDNWRDLIFDVDGRFIQIRTVPISDFREGDPFHPVTANATLREYRQWEMDQFAKEFGRTVFASDDMIRLENGTSALLWSFNPPISTFDATSSKRTYLLAVVKADRILVAISPVKSSDPETDKSVRAFLLDTINTLRSSDTP